MSHSDSEEQFQEIKEFLAKKWKIIVAVIVIGLLGIWGWRYWQSHQAEKTALASDKYELLISKLSASDPKAIEELVTFAKDTDTIYSVFANLKAAQYYVETLKDYATAQSLLTMASKQTNSAPVLAIINTRIARLQYQLEEYEDSLKTLAKVTTDSWASVVNDIRGDVLTKLEKYQEAYNAYQVSLASNPQPAELEKNIKMKLNQAQYLKEKQAIEQEEQEKINAEKAAQEAANAVDNAPELPEEQKDQIQP